MFQCRQLSNNFHHLTMTGVIARRIIMTLKVNLSLACTSRGKEKLVDGYARLCCGETVLKGNGGPEGREGFNVGNFLQASFVNDPLEGSHSKERQIEKSDIDTVSKERQES